MVGVTFVYVGTVYWFYRYSFLCLIRCFSMIIWTPTVLSVIACVLYFCIRTCSARWSMFHVERRSRNTLILLLLLRFFFTFFFVIFGGTSASSQLSWRCMLNSSRPLDAGVYCPWYGGVVNFLFLLVFCFSSSSSLFYHHYHCCCCCNCYCYCCF